MGIHCPDLFYIENLHDNSAKSFYLHKNSARFALVFSKAVLNEGASPRPLGASYHFKSIKSLVMSELIKLVEATIENRKSEYPDFKSGDTINVHVKIREGNKERIQQFQGTVMQRRNVNGAGETFTVRKISNGIGVERVFPILSPSIAKIELIRRGKVRRSRLFFLRGRQGKAARIKELKTTK
jgi:large subunit ribosomal protein L19